jgi:hypothetical protein
VKGPEGVLGVLEQAANRAKKSIAVSPIRVLVLRAAKRPVIKRRASRTRTICRVEGGVVLLLSGATRKPLVMSVSVPGIVGEAELETLHVEFIGAPEQLKETDPVKPPRPVTVMLMGSDVCPFLTVKLEGVAPKLKSQPVPVNATVWGLLGSLSMMVSIPVRGFEVDVGVNVTLIVQLEFPARLPLQLFVSPKSPEAAMELIVRVLELLLDSITGCAVLVVVTS